MKTTLNDLLNAKGVSEPLREAVKALLDRLKEAESDSLEQARLNGIGAERELALMAKLEAAENERDALRADLNTAKQTLEELIPKYTQVRKEHLLSRAKIEQMEKQEPVAFVKRNLTGQILLVDARGNGFDLMENLGVSLFALPGAQNVPKEAISKILTEVMDIAVSNGADSRSMPDEYVEVAAWLCGYAPLAPSVPEGFKLVPIEPTDAMLKAAQKEWLNDPLRRTTTMWKAVLAATKGQ